MNGEELKLKARDVRIDVVKAVAEAGSGHPGGSLSMTDVMVALYFGGVLRHDADDPTDPKRDRFILSKGHAAPALYAVLAEAGYLPVDELLTLRKLGSRLQGHPDCLKCPGVEVSTGSLGQGLSIACGLACGLRLEDNPAHVFTLLGDGECQEGQVWEAAMFAAHQKLGNLTAIVDRNGLQIDGSIDEVCSPGDIGAKFSAFGWEVIEVDGHDLDTLVEVLTASRDRDDARPRCIVARTVKGRGVSFMEGKASWHGVAPKPDQRDEAVAELLEKGPVRD